MTELLDDADRIRLLRLARAAIQQSLLSNGSLETELARMQPSAALLAERGAFVSLKKRAVEGRETLRGCVGTIVARGPLTRTVVEVARKAAFEDPRFEPVTADELDALRIEVSALSPLREVVSAEEIEIGRHGVQLVRGTSMAVFLPQVAVEYGWDRAKLLEQLALKARLPGDGWSGARLSVFEAEVFGEPRDDGPCGV